jgi:hypothetical protein
LLAALGREDSSGRGCYTPIQLIHDGGRDLAATFVSMPFR